MTWNPLLRICYHMYTSLSVGARLGTIRSSKVAKTDIVVSKIREAVADDMYSTHKIRVIWGNRRIRGGGGDHIEAIECVLIRVTVDEPLSDNISSIWHHDHLKLNPTITTRHRFWIDTEVLYQFFFRYCSFPGACSCSASFIIPRASPPPVVCVFVFEMLWSMTVLRKNVSDDHHLWRLVGFTVKWKRWSTKRWCQGVESGLVTRSELGAVSVCKWMSEHESGQWRHHPTPSTILSRLCGISMTGALHEAEDRGEDLLVVIDRTFRLRWVKVTDDWWWGWRWRWWTKWCFEISQTREETIGRSERCECVLMKAASLVFSLDFILVCFLLPSLHGP